jgi:hypothetical protein
MTGPAGRINSYRILREEGLTVGSTCLWVLRPEGGIRHSIISDIDYGPLGLEFIRAWRSKYRPYERRVILAKTQKYRRIKENAAVMHNPRWIVGLVMGVAGIGRYKVDVVKDIFITRASEKTLRDIESFCEHLNEREEPK